MAVHLYWAVSPGGQLPRRTSAKPTSQSSSFKSKNQSKYPLPIEHNSHLSITCPSTVSSVASSPPFFVVAKLIMAHYCPPEARRQATPSGTSLVRTEVVVGTNKPIPHSKTNFVESTNTRLCDGTCVTWVWNIQYATDQSKCQVNLLHSYPRLFGYCGVIVVTCKQIFPDTQLTSA